MKILRRATAIIIMLAVIFASAMPAFAQMGDNSGEKRTVKVAYPEQKYLTEIDSNGSYDGYSYEYLKKVAEFANWKLEYVMYPDMTLDEQIMGAMADVESGKADLMGVMLQNDAMKETYLYPDKNYGVVYTTLDVLDTNYSLNETNYMKRSPLRVAVLTNAKTRNAELEAYVQDNGIECEYVYCSSVDEQLAALKDGRADALLKVSLTFLPNLKQIAQFSARPFYFITNLENQALMDELDDAITKINITDPYFETRLQDKYFQNTMADFSLNEKELAFVEKNKELQVLLIPDFAPFAFVNEKGELGGMSVLILNELGNKLGINFTYHVLQNDEDTAEMIRSGGYDIVIGPPHSTQFAEDNGLVLSQPYIEASLTMFTNKASVAKAKSDSVLALMCDVAETINYDYKEIHYYNSVLECLNAVNNGEADYGYASTYLIDFYTSQSSHKNLTYLNLTGYNREIGFFVPNTEDTALLSIINKYVSGLPTKNIHSYLAQALAQKPYNAVRQLAQDNPVLIIIILVAFLSLIMLAITLMIFNRINKQRNDKLQLAFSAKSDFLSRMSHDMRTPMNGIIGLTGLTMEIEGLPKEATDNLKKIDDSSKYLLNLINDTLDMNKIESNKINLNTEPTDLSTFIDQIISVSQVSADQKHVNLEVCRSTDSVPPVLLDRVRVQQIVFNIVSNAIKFTPENGTVSICTSGRVSAYKVCTCITISDTGIGISSEFLNKMFEPFEQENSSATSQYSGTGLGLAIVKNLVSLMNGTISVESEKNVGTKFTINLDFDIADAQVEQPVAPSCAADLNGKRVLLCEDHPLNTEIAKKLLLKKEIVVDYAQNGKVAVEKFAKSPTWYYDAILMDIRMPIMDGLTATRRIREIPRPDAKTIPIIAMTANAFDEDKQKSLAVGMSAHLTKPIVPDSLYETLQELIK